MSRWSRPYKGPMAEHEPCLSKWAMKWYSDADSAPNINTGDILDLIEGTDMAGFPRGRNRRTGEEIPLALKSKHWKKLDEPIEQVSLEGIKRAADIGTPSGKIWKQPFKRHLSCTNVAHDPLVMCMSCEVLIARDQGCDDTFGPAQFSPPATTSKPILTMPGGVRDAVFSSWNGRVPR